MLSGCEDCLRRWASLNNQPRLHKIILGRLYGRQDTTLKNYRRSEHVELRHHYVRKLVETGLLFITKVRALEMIADFLTKPLKKHGVRKGNEKVDVGVKDN